MPHPSALPEPHVRRRIRVRITGIVQGVGFRPFVFRLADDLGLAGCVLNDEKGVLLEAEGENSAIEALLERLPLEVPPLAAISSISVEEVPVVGADSFQIVTSASGGQPSALVPPDIATCDDCLQELFDPANRRFRYPFINCTNCGPRYTIIRSLPYDRGSTTMAGFEMCQECRTEYLDPRDRRFHAQPNACSRCGPRAQFVSTDGRVRLAGAPGEAITAATAALREGAILALKGLGGFHLACRADDEQVIGRLRERKHRSAKPFALMLPDLPAAHRLVQLDAREEELLSSRERPILIARRREPPCAKPPASPTRKAPNAGRQGRGAEGDAPGDAPPAPLAAGGKLHIADNVAPGSNLLGVMLPYTPLHHLLLAEFARPLVMTSGNRADEPILYDNEVALSALAEIADCFLLHDRPIERRADDSVLTSNPDSDAPIMIRRSRGFVPLPIELPIESPQPILACGAQQKNSFCAVRRSRAWPGPHIGDLRSLESLLAFREGIDGFLDLLSLTPQVLAYDLHPEYLASKYALERTDLQPIAVQHHHAHLAACLAEHGEQGPAIGAIFDGAGFGPDGSIWGGEFLLADLCEYRRLGHLWPVPMPGGDAAAREPARMACAWLRTTFGETAAMPPTLADILPSQRWQAIVRLLESRIPAPTTTSVGRLFDAVAALLGLRAKNEFEAHAAIELEAIADPHELNAYPMPIVPGPGPEHPFRLDARQSVHALVDEIRAGTPTAVVAARFHNCLAHATASAALSAACTEGIDTIVLAGGVFQNRMLLRRTRERLQAQGVRVLTPERLPLNDGGIAFGQAAVAAARLARGQ